MKKIIYIIAYIVCSVILASSCNSEEAKGVIPMGDKLRVIETNISLTKDAARRTLTVESNCMWDFNIERSSNWSSLIIQKVDAGLTIETDENATRSIRQATITIKSKSGIIRTVYITQAQGDIQLEVQGGENKTLTFLFSGGKQEFTITSNTSWEITGMGDWFSLDKQSGTGTDKVEITVNEIQTDVARNSTLVISAENGTKTDYIIIQQQEKVIELSVSPQILTFPAYGGSKEIQITCNADWTAIAAHDWVQLSQYSGSQSKTLTITLPENKNMTKLESTITIKSGRDKIETISLDQSAATLPEVGMLMLLEGTVGRHEATLSFSATSVFPITACGLCYSISNMMPTTSDTCQKVTDNTLSVVLTGLESGTTYYVRAYATSDIGTVYSSNVVIITTAGSDPDENDNPVPNPR